MKKDWMEGWENTVEIRDPSKINIQDATKLYDHWRTRQKQKRLQVFKFVKALASDKRTKFDVKGQRKRKRSTQEDKYNSSDLDEDNDEEDHSSSDGEKSGDPSERLEDRMDVDVDKEPAVGILKMKRKRGEEE
jgi:hypothetical protein